MNRYSDVEKMEDAMLKIRSANKKLDFITHLLAGFPTETEEDFKKSIDFIKKCKVNNVSIYLYFAVPDTPAFRMGGQVSLDVVKRRVAAAGKELDKAGIYWTFEELAL
jgi:tRNA A37 methylthiotransferase MiaB